MQEYQENGAKLGWLIDRNRKKVEIYRPKKSVEVQNSPNSLSGEDILPGFTLDLSEIWN
jgi:Uma2 family endonuclease